MAGKGASSSSSASEALQAELRVLNITDGDNNLRTREFGPIDKVYEATNLDAADRVSMGQVINTRTNTEPRHSLSYQAESVVGNGSFGVVFKAKCLENGEVVAIKKVLQDKRFKNRELQIMRMLDHPNVVSLRHCFYSTTPKDEVYLNLVLEFVPDTVYRMAKHYTKLNQR